MKKKITLLLSLALAVAIGIGGTLAWLTAKTDAVTNTFTVGNINIALEETTTDYKMVPGQPIDKDPKVTVEAGSEACWLFVKIEESANLDSFIDYAIADGWTALTGVDGVYYREVAATADDMPFSVLANDQVTVKDTVTKAMMDEITAQTASAPTLTFTAYAVQKDGLTTAANAWGQIPTT